MEEETDEEPGGEGDPFGEREVTGEDGEKLHEQEQKRDEDTESGDEAQARSPFNKEEG